MKTGNAPLKSIRPLDQVREHIRYLYYSVSTEKVYLHWVPFFTRRHGRGGRIKHLRDLGPREREAFFTMIADGQACTSVQIRPRPLCVAVFYRERLTIDSPCLTEVRIRYGLSGFCQC